MENFETFDVIIIGAGIGGLNCAAQLSLNNRKVLVLEKNGFVGGRCSGYKKNGYTVDYGVHAFVKGKEGPLQTLIDRAQDSFDHPLLEWVRIDPGFLIGDQLLKSYLPLNWKHFWNYIRTGINFLKIKIPFKDKIAFARFLLKLRSISEKDLPKYKDISIKELVEKHTRSPFVHQLISITADCYAVQHYEYVAAQDYIEIFTSTMNSRGIYYPKGGCQAIPDAYKEIIESHGGKILLSKEVDTILFDLMPNNKYRATGVKIKNSDENFFSNYIVSNVNWKEFLYLIPELTPPLFPKEFNEKINNLIQSFSAIVMHIAFKEKIIEPMFVMKPSGLTSFEIAQRRRKGEWIEDIGCFIPAVSNMDPSLAPEGKQLVILGFGEDIKGIMADEQDIEPFKKLAMKFLKKIVKKGKDVEENIEWMEIYSRKQLSALFGNNGSIISVAQQIGQVRDDRLDNRTTVKGLFHCGDGSGKGLFGVGSEIAALSGQRCASLIEEDFQDFKISN
jgi:phytoene desaturase